MKKNIRLVKILSNNELKKILGGTEPGATCTKDCSPTKTVTCTATELCYTTEQGIWCKDTDETYPYYVSCVLS